ncbi:MAG: ABC-2 family transporter protein [Thermaerobacter sp.]|nr:ABC-2 family transporter protein [Thermaerobacter sp.]
MSGLRKLLSVFRAYFRSVWAYPGAEAMRTIFLVVIMIVFLSLWRTTYSAMGATRLGGLSLPQMLEYLVGTEAIVLAAPAFAARIGDDVRTGGLSVQLTRPVSYVAFQFAVAAGESWPRLALNLLVGTALVWLVTGVEPLSAAGVAAYLIAYLPAFLLYASLFLTLALTSFWLEDAWAITFVASRMVMILGGLLVPLSLFPAALRTVARILPLQLMVYGPAQQLSHPFAALGTLLLSQAIWLAVLGGLLWFVYARGVRALHVHGG